MSQMSRQIGWMVLCVVSTAPLAAQQVVPSSTDSTLPLGSERVEVPQNSTGENGWTELKSFTEAEIREQCRRYEGRYISYYGSIFLVKNCQRKEVISEKMLKRVPLTDAKVEEVRPDVIAMIPAGEPIRESFVGSKDRHCKELEGRYVTLNYAEFSLVDQCKRRIFPDWETFVSHRKETRNRGVEILLLTQKEFYRLAEGVEVPSVTDAEYKLLRDNSAFVDFLPIDEACEGLNGKIVSYVSRIYKIEGCRKRELDASLWSLGQKGLAPSLELTSSQWVSLPDGAPIAIAPSY